MMIKSTGAGLCLLVALAGCGGSLPGSRSSAPNFTGPVEPTNPTHTVTVAASTVTVNPPVHQDVRVGDLCQVEGEVGRTMTGRMARCVRRTGQSAVRWVLDAGSQPDGTVKPGQSCPAPGALGTDGFRDYRCEPVPQGTGGPVWTAG